MGLQDCRIQFDNPYKTYYVGQTINGHVELVFDSPKKVRGISICFKGEANTSWFVEESKQNAEGNQVKERIELEGSEEYFKIQYYLVGGQSGNEEITLPAGSHSYPFSCMLPPTLPSSFEGEFGRIRYTVKVTLDRPWKFDQEIKDAYTVLSPLDLNSNPRLKEPFKYDVEKFFCCCWCKSGPLTFVISVPQTGFVPGQVIPVLCELDNISDVEVSSVYFAFNKLVVYHTQRPRRESKRQNVKITEFTAEAVAARESKTWHQQITIPPLPPSNLANCTLIDLSYELQIEARVSGLHQNLLCTIPITLGTVPLGSQNAPALLPSGGDVTINMAPPAQPQAPPSNLGWQANGGGLYPNITQPTLGPSQFGTPSIQDRNDNEYTRYPNNNQQYTPMYPVYNYPQPV